jgi:hypothetical protein
MPRRFPAFWLALLLVPLALANVAAEGYLSSFGPAGMDTSPTASVAEILYDLRHLVTFLLPVLLAPAALVLAVFALVQAWQLRRAPVGLLSTVGVLVGGVVLLGSVPLATHPVRVEGFRRAAERMEPLVLAVARFERENGAPPASLEQLAPGYLRNVRRFGVRGCRELEYRTRGIPGEWELRLECPNGWITLDQFFYRPGERYQPNEYNQRFGRWAYFWD